jgi:hypothetical protein
MWVKPPNIPVAASTSNNRSGWSMRAASRPPPRRWPTCRAVRGSAPRHSSRMRPSTTRRPRARGSRRAKQPSSSR